MYPSPIPAHDKEIAKSLCVHTRATPMFSDSLSALVAVLEKSESTVSDVLPRSLELFTAVLRPLLRLLPERHRDQARE